VNRLQVGARPVEEASFVSTGAGVVAGDRAQLGGQLPVRDQRRQADMSVQGGRSFVEVDHPKRSARRGGKSDDTDAARAAREALAPNVRAARAPTAAG